VKARKRIYLYGNSVILGTIGASLSRFSEYEVVTLKVPSENAQNLAAFVPDVLVFDSDATRTEEVFSFLKINPAMLLIGISPDINRVKVWSTRELQEATMQDLLGLIKNETVYSPVASGGDAVRLA
jgi:hypothetical protein